MQFKQFVINGSIFSWGSKEYGANTLILLFPYSLKSGLACRSPACQTIRNIRINKIIIELPKRTNGHIIAKLIKDTQNFLLFVC